MKLDGLSLYYIYTNELNLPKIIKWIAPPEHFYKIKGKLRIWFLSYTPYFNLVHNLLIVSIWSLTFQYRVNLDFIVNF